MRYRVTRPIGDSDRPVGTIFDGAGLDPARLTRLREQRLIEAVTTPDQALSAVEVEALRDEIALLRAEVAELREQFAAAQESEQSDENGNAAVAELDYDAMPVGELRDRASERDIPGRSGMNKEELIAALRQPPAEMTG